MKLGKLIALIICTLLITFSPSHALQRKRGGSKARTTKVSTKKKSSKRSTSRTKSRSKSKRSTSRRQSRQRNRQTRLTPEQLQEQREQDSLRLFTGAITPVSAVPIRKLVADEPPLQRFIQGDTTIQKRAIEQLYLNYRYTSSDKEELNHLEQQADQLISAHKLPEALGLITQGLWKYPLSISLIKRGCDLTHHLQSRDIDKYLWQITELFRVIELTGDGKAMPTAYRVRSINDALLFETHWLDNDREHILSRREQESEGHRYYVLKVMHTDEKTKAQSQQEHYYLLEQ